VGILGQGMIAGLFTTTRLTRVGAEHYQSRRARGEHQIFALWHGMLLPLTYYHQGEGAVVLVSEHADGEYISRVLHRMGYQTARGSSTRGGTKGLRGLVRAAREGRDLAVTPDGPRGPARIFKPGVLVAAQLTGLPIIPVGVGVSSSWHANSWDRFTVPRPLARIRIHYGEPVEIPRRLDEKELDSWAEVMERRMNELQDLAQSLARGELADADGAGGEA
jgi:lysophospholipid acyltransferase (LPLAT)-like uncharacterized protein